MSWRDRWQPASFRGVPFLTEAHTTKVGRRVAVKEYPYHDTTTTQDMGRKARGYTLTAYVVGDDHDLQRDRLIAALEQKGAGELVHPDYGRQWVVAGVNDVSSDQQQRITKFTLNFEQAGDINQRSRQQINVQAQRNQAYAGLQTATQAHFAHNLGGQA